MLPFIHETLQDTVGRLGLCACVLHASSMPTQPDTAQDNSVYKPMLTLAAAPAVTVVLVAGAGRCFCMARAVAGPFQAA
jgi:hypothetical protein